MADKHMKTCSSLAMKNIDDSTMRHYYKLIIIAKFFFKMVALIAGKDEEKLDHSCSDSGRQLASFLKTKKKKRKN